ncbi:MAG: DEAD/DEAH box helicase [Pseudomonadota bacterium]
MPEALPIDAIIPDLLRVVSSSNRLVLSAAPGAGKTTRVPVALLNTAPRDGGRILVLEPRRIAARTAAERMAAERGERVGETVGYRVRGESKISKSTRIEVITEGILTRMLQNDPELPGIDALIFDEIHERSIHTDLGLALALEAQEALRPDLRIIAMSATLDTRSFSQLLGDCPVIECPGQSFMIETIWLDRPLGSKPSKHSGRRSDGLEVALSTLCLRALEETDGNVLVFLPGVAEIRRMVTALTAHDLLATVEMLYGALPLAQQRQILRADPDGTRRIILSTAIAETSLTVPGVRTVIDAGLSRRIQTDPVTGMSVERMIRRVPSGSARRL